MAGSAEFEKAVTTVNNLKEEPSNEEKLDLYALFKVGNKTSIEGVPKPSTFDFKAKYKYNAWKAMVDEGVSATDAQARYVKLVNELVKKHGLKS